MPPKKMTTRSASANAADTTTITASVQHHVSTSELISLSDDVLQVICKSMAAKDIYAVSTHATVEYTQPQ